MNTDIARRPPTPNAESGPHPEAPRPGLFDLFHLRYQAWLAEEGTEAQGRILACQQQMIVQQQAVAAAQLQARATLARAELEAQTALAAAELTARRQRAELTLEAEEAEAELRLHRRLQQAPPQAARLILDAEIETQKLLAERDQLRRLRLTGPASPPSPAALPLPGSPALAPGTSPAGTPALDVHITDQQIESLALRAVTRFSSLEPSEAERMWARWRQELSERLPVYAVQEVTRRAEELRELLR